jgi:hypothetical protein
VRDADACLMIADARGLAVSRGTLLAQKLAHRDRKPLFAAEVSNPESLRGAVLWLRVQQARNRAAFKLAIGGPRESEAPGIYARGKDFIDAMLAAAGL